MTTNWIDLVESSPGIREARLAIDRELTGQDGQSYFERVRNLLGQDRERARRLASRWRLLADQPQTRSWAFRTKGVLDRIDGRWLASVNSFKAAARHADGASEKLLVQVGAIDSLGRAGRVKEAVRLANQIASGLTAVGLTREAGQAHLNAANALLWHDEYVKARNRFALALERFDPVLDQTLHAAATLGLSTSELFGGHPRKAHDLALAAETELDLLGLPEFSTLAKKNRAQASLLLGRVDEALDLLLEIRQTESADELESGRLEEFLGDTYGRMNLWNEARDAYQSALALKGYRSSALNLANASLGLGTALDQIGRRSDAIVHLRRAATAYRRFENLPWEAMAMIRIGRWSRESGRVRESARILQRSVETLRAHHSPTLLAEAHLELAQTLIHLAKNPTQDIDTANRIVKRRHLLQMEWRVHYLRARAVEPRLKRLHFRKMVVAIWQARTLMSSTVSRASYLSDKAVALSEYVAHLLQTPTPRNVDEALDVVRQSRSVALLEEILSSTSDPSGRVQERLVTLREELNAAIGGESSSGATRREVKPIPNLDALQRQWVEVNRDVRESSIHIDRRHEWPEVVLIDSPNQLFLVGDGSAHKLTWSPQSLRDKLTWLKFELIAPMVERTVSPERAIALLEEFAEAMWSPNSAGSGKVVRVCPEGHFWQVPWQAIASLNDGQEAVLAVGAWSNKAENTLRRSPRAMIWHHSTPGLPHIDREAELFLDHFPDAVSCSRIEQVREVLARGHVDLLHVACHASFHPTNPIFSALSFDGGRVTAAEIARSGFHAGQVVLSACETGTVSLLNNTEPEGLVRAFLARGAASVLASTWPLDDETATKFMYTYFQALIGGESVAASASLSRSAVRRSCPHPYFWGPFALFGGYSS